MDMAAGRARFLAGWLARFRPAARPVDELPPSLPRLEYLREPQAADWLRTSVTTFAESVASFLPGHFEAYARVHHPFGGSGAAAPATSWRELYAAEGLDPCDPVAAEALAYRGCESGQARIGSLPRVLIGPIIEHLRAATTTPDRCFFALWEGFGDSPVPHTFEPMLELPHRRYHLFAGPIDGARTALSSWRFGDQSANLWWPADRRWCVATEIDSAWTYVGATRSCIDALLADARLEAFETMADARW